MSDLFRSEDVARFNKWAAGFPEMKTAWLEAANGALRFSSNRGDAVKAANRYISKLRRKYYPNPPEETMLSNPWSEKDVKHKNKLADSTAASRKLWVRVANATLERTGDDRMAIIAANIAVKNHFAKRKRKNPPMGPAKGETVLLCTHFSQRGGLFGDIHWFNLGQPPLKFSRQDGSVGEATWLALCADCFKNHKSRPLRAPIGGDVVWGRDGFGDGLDLIGGTGVTGNPGKSAFGAHQGSCRCCKIFEGVKRCESCNRLVCDVCWNRDIRACVDCIKSAQRRGQ